MFKKYIIPIILTVTSSFLHAKEKDFSKFPPDQEIVYKTIDDANLKFYVYEPEGHLKTDKKPAIILFFGGGWVGGRASKLSAQCDFFTKHGFVAITAEYRIKGRHKTTPKECVKDGKSAIRWLRNNAGELGIDPDKIIGGGASAGGHVAAATGTDVKIDEETDDLNISARPNALVLFNPVFDNSEGNYGYDRVSDYWEVISPRHNIDDKTPPTIAFFGDNDKHITVDTIKDYQEEMKKAGVRCDLFIYPGKAHGFFNYHKGKENEYFDKTMEESLKFLKSLGY